MVCYACNDTDDVHVGLRTSEFQCSSGFNAVDLVALNCGSQVDVDVFEVVLTIGGATSSTVIKGLHFDVVYPRDRFSYVAGSASMVADNFLTWGDGDCDVGNNICIGGAIGDTCANHKACNVPGVMMPVLTASESLDPPGDPTMPNIVDGRLSIMIDRMPPTGVGATLGGPDAVLRFRLQATSLTKPTDPTLLKFENDAAVNINDTPIGTVVFNDQLILWVQ